VNSLSPRAPEQYCCPGCRGNRAFFDLIFRMVQAVDKDARTGEVRAARGEPYLEAAADGMLRMDVRCRSCGFEGPESMFIAEARRRPPY
jgi:hypothetical protein